MSHTGFFWDEACFWHTGGGYAFTSPVGGLVQPFVSGGLPEDPETKRRFKNLIDRTGLARDLSMKSADPISRHAAERVHPASYLEALKSLSDSGGGEIVPGSRAPVGPGTYEIALQSAGLVTEAARAVMRGTFMNAYALCRPPGHHALPDHANGFCYLNNIAIAIRALQAGIGRSEKLKIAVVDWDVHHGNGTEAIFYDDPDVLTISIHQERNYPWDQGEIDDQGSGDGVGFNMNIPLPAGAGHESYLEAMDRLIVPKLYAFKPDLIFVACGFDASGVDPLSRMLCGSETFAAMTRKLMMVAQKMCDGRIVMAHEGGYSELHVPFCGHAVLEVMSGSEIRAADPLGPRMASQQPGEEMVQVMSFVIDRYVKHFDLVDIYACP
jgi:acetoin utilization deacetylase AcuC-like enzyme